MEIAVIICLAAVATVLFVWKPNGQEFNFLMASSLPDHDLSENRVTSTSTAWRQSYCCPHCKNAIGHDEFMTKICLSCGNSVESSLAWRSGAYRKVVRNGNWVRHLRVGRSDYIYQDGKWVSAQALSHPTNQEPRND